jgi:hypothetical protein
MWLFTVNGFFTIIQDRKDANYVWLRARLREDIERNFPGVEVTEHPGADYLFRAKLPREQVAQRVMELVMENNVTSHFKDVMIRTASKPKHGSRSGMLYGVWNAGAAMQPIPPYSKTPRPEPKPFYSGGGKGGWKPGDRTVGAGQSDLFTGRGSESQGLYGGAGAGYRASEFDWDSQSWGGKSTADPAFPVRPKESVNPDLLGDLETMDTDAVLELLASVPIDSPEYDEIWGALTTSERQLVLDREENAQRLREEIAGEAGFVVTDVLPDPRNRPGSRRQRRKEARKKGRHNRHNQEQHGNGTMTDAQYAQYAQERRDGKHGKRQQDRQAYLDARVKESGR